MRYADLHIHSSYSDGNLLPEEIVKIAIEQKVRYISITDHDTIDSQYISKEKIDNIHIIPGIEFSTEYGELEIHILGYFIDIDDVELNKVVDKLKFGRIKRIEKILERLKMQNIFLELDDVIIDKSSNIGRAHIANAMVAKGYVHNFKEAFNKYLIKGKPAYVKGDKLKYKDILDIINNCGGIAVLAHPGKIYRSLEVEDMIRNLKCYGLKGLEVYHPSHSKNQINTFYNYCKKYKLIITGGSDFHNLNNRDNFIGNEGINELLLDKLINFKYKQ